MLATFLDRIGSLVSRSFVVGFFVPVLVFAFLNALLLGWQVKAFREWAPGQFEGFRGLYAVPLLIGLAVVAYLMFSVNVYLRQVLEGRRLLPDRVLKNLAERERARHDCILQAHKKARSEFYAIMLARSQWKQELIEASDEGHEHPRPGATYPNDAPAAVDVRNLVDKRRKAEPISQAEVGAAVTSVGEVLRTIDRGAAHPDAVRLCEDYEELLESLDYAEGAWDARRIALLNRLETQFGPGDPRPTRMGNVAAAMEGYAQTRYRMNLDTFWNRMQPVLQANDKFYAVLIDAKTQLDFLVVSCWLCIFTAVCWLLAMPWLEFSWTFYLLVAALAPVLARFFYELAVENYLVFADIVKSAIDLFRFQLLKSLHIPQPTGIRQERAVWASLQDLSTFGREGFEITYQHDGS